MYPHDDDLPPDAGKLRPGEGFIIVGFFIGIMYCLFALYETDLKNHPDTFEHYHGSSE